MHSQLKTNNYIKRLKVQVSSQLVIFKLKTTFYNSSKKYLSEGGFFVFVFKCNKGDREKDRKCVNRSLLKKTVKVVCDINKKKKNQQQSVFVMDQSELQLTFIAQVIDTKYLSHWLKGDLVGA